ncbi:aromatic ring-hydroxylating oxygenase subunit alpha [Aurantiacibacter odishensis]|uniref:aromatic ring-hydroxylating oxygenase subunit alpha n=1 Tax=Aurantiacibacter odishensis TaxID=1155476 RepID=UPI000E759014|nr:aromatic ring-hydroxylating dioxygenase subunit alpha [Aurantiacibacter odishensis]
MDAVETAQIKDRMKFEAARKSPPEDFPQLPPIPAGRYTDPKFLRLERELVWKRAWLYACHADQIANLGDWMLVRNTGSPVIVLRDLSGDFKAFYNTCQHRGAPLVTEESGNGRGFVCGYHGWSYTLDGKLTAVRDKRDFTDLDFSCHSLKPLRCETIGKLVFINEDAEAEPLREHLGPMAGELEQYQFEKLDFVESRSYEVECNVKVLIDAFLEVYHLKSIHQKSVDRFLDHRGMTASLWPNGHSRMVTPNKRPDWQDPGTIGMPKVDGVTEIPRDNNVSYMIYPNFVMPPSDSGIPLLQFWPTGDRTCRVVSTWIAPDHDPEKPHPKWEERAANWERILYEDLQFAPQIQESLQSPGFVGMPLNYQERRIYHWHEELDRRIGANRIPEGLAVEKVLSPWVEA